MGIPDGDVVTLIYRLLPGFLAAAVFHSLTPYPRRDVLDRVVAALIFTLLSEVSVSFIHPFLLWVGSRAFSLGVWDDESRLATTASMGLIFGVGWATLVNRGYPHHVLSKWGVTRKTSLPTQWYDSFATFERFVIINFMDGRRLMGWPRGWPDEPDAGHFLIERPIWVLDDGTKADMVQVEALLVRAAEVESVEFLRFRDDPKLSKESETVAAAKGVLERERKKFDNERDEPQEHRDKEHEPTR